MGKGMHRAILGFVFFLTVLCLMQPLFSESTIQKCYVNVVNSVWEFTANTYDINRDANFLNTPIYSQGNISSALINCRLADLKILPLNCIKLKLLFETRGAMFSDLPKEITLSEENNYYFKQNLANQTDKFFEIKLDVKNGLLKKIHYAFHGSHLGNRAKWQLICLEEKERCECSEGECCDGCHFKSPETACKKCVERICDNNYAVKISFTQFCSGHSSECDGNIEKKELERARCEFMCSQGVCIEPQDKNMPVIAEQEKKEKQEKENFAALFGIIGYIISAIIICAIAALLFMRMRRH